MKIYDKIERNIHFISLIFAWLLLIGTAVSALGTLYFLIMLLVDSTYYTEEFSNNMVIILNWGHQILMTKRSGDIISIQKN